MVKIKIIFLVILLLLLAKPDTARAVFSTVVNPNGNQCLTVGTVYTVKVTSDADHVALYYRTDGQQPAHLDSSVIKHPLQQSQGTTTATWGWTLSGSHISETGRVWVDGHQNDHDSFNTWDSSNADFAVRSDCTGYGVTGGAPPASQKLVAPANFDIPAALVDFLVTTSTILYRYSSEYSGNFQVYFYDAPYTTFLLQSRELDLKPGGIFTFEERNLLPNTFYPGSRKVQAYHRHGFWSALSEPSPPFWTAIEIPEKMEITKLTPTSVTLKVLTPLFNLGKGQSAVYFENITENLASGWVTSTVWTFASLTPDTVYQFWTKARSGEGTNTRFGGLVTTRTPKEGEVTTAEEELRLKELRAIKENLERQIESLKKQIAIREKPFKKFTQFLTRGSQGPEVVSLQQILGRDPAIYPEGLITGYFGPLTEAAVKRLQEKYEIEPLGIVGPKTRAILETLWR